jgi:hypothetical protein
VKSNAEVLSGITEETSSAKEESKTSNGKNTHTKERHEVNKLFSFNGRQR